MRLPGLPRTRLAPLVASGLLLGAAFPPFHLLVPSFVALVPYGLWVARLPPGPEGRSEALRGGFLMGLLFFTLLLYWLLAALILYTPLAVLAFLLPVLVLAGILALVTLGIHQALRVGVPLWLALPLFWTAAEWLRAHLGDVSFPWMQLGDSLTGYPRLIGAADLVGSRGMSFWLALANGLLAEAALRWSPAWLERWLPGGSGGSAASRGGAGDVNGPAAGTAGDSGGRGSASGGAAASGGGDGAPPGPAWRPLVAWLLVVTIPVGYSLYRWQTLEVEPAATVSVAQPNIPEDIKLDRWAAVDSTVRSLRTLLAGELSEAAGETEMLVLPESAFPVPLDPVDAWDYPGAPRVEDWVGGVARRLDAPVLFGSVGVDNLSEEEFRHFNSAFLLDRTGRRTARYDKRELVPVIERVPFVNPDWFRGTVSDILGPYFGGNSIGRTEVPFSLDGREFGVLICYESIFTGLSRGYRRDGADFLVNITNDAWFGREEPWWSRTSALWQHPAHLVMRAVENRVGIVRSANTGISGMVDPLGRLSPRTSLFEAAAFTAPVLTTRERTLYTRWGDVVGWAAALGALGVVVATGVGGRRDAGS